MSNLAGQNKSFSIVPNMSNDDYHAHENLSSTQIKDFINHTPAYFYAKHIAKTMKPVEKKAFSVGSAIHALWMEPEKFLTEFAVAPKINKRTKAGKQEWLDFTEANQGKTLIEQKDMELIDAACHSLQSNMDAMALKADCLIENSIFWTDEETGLNLKARPDMLRLSSNKSACFIPDLKSTKDASLNAFQRDIFNYGYHISAAMYLDAVEQLGEKPEAFIFICVENVEPYLTAIYTLSDEAIEIGRTKYREALNDIAECFKTNNWYGHNQDKPAEISLPQWVINKELNQ